MSGVNVEAHAHAAHCRMAKPTIKILPQAVARNWDEGRYSYLYWACGRWWILGIIYFFVRVLYGDFIRFFSRSVGCYSDFGRGLSLLFFAGAVKTSLRHSHSLEARVLFGTTRTGVKHFYHDGCAFRWWRVASYHRFGSMYVIWSTNMTLQQNHGVSHWTTVDPTVVGISAQTVSLAVTVHIFNKAHHHPGTSYYIQALHTSDREIRYITI